MMRTQYLATLLVSLMLVSCTDSVERAEDDTSLDTLLDTPGEDTITPDTGDPVEDPVEDTTPADTTPADTSDVPADTGPDTIGLPCESDEDCEMGLYCDGDEYCHPSGVCRRSPPIDCNDGDGCTTDSCDEDADDCTHVLTDADGDLFGPESCGGPDCDDTDSAINPDATEICDDGIDQDCDGIDQPAGACDCPVEVTVPSTTTGDTTAMTSAYNGDCAFSSGAVEAIHRLVLTSAANVYVDMTGTSFTGYVYIRQGACDGTELDCASSWMGGFGISLAAGTYYIFVDGTSSMTTPGPYMLDIDTWVPPTPVTGNNTCPSAYVLTADGTYGGNNTSMTDTSSGSCSFSGGRDVWFRFTLTAASTVTLDTSGSDYYNAIYVRAGSCTGTEAGCNRYSGTGYGALLTLTLAAGTYYVAVDALASTYAGDYVLSVTGL